MRRTKSWVACCLGAALSAAPVMAFESESEGGSEAQGVAAARAQILAENVTSTTSGSAEGSAGQPAATRFAMDPGPAQHLRAQLPAGRLSASVPDGGASFTALGVSMFAASMGDLISTEWGLGRGASEMNPLQGNRSVRVVSHAAAPLVAWWASERARKAGKEKLAWFIRIGFTVAYSYVTVHNVRSASALP